MTKAKINPNKQYKTRDGREVTNIEISDDLTDDEYPVTAQISGGHGFASFTKFGYYYGKEELTGLDLIEVKQPKKKSTPKQEPVQVTETKAPEKHLHYSMIVAWAENPKLEVQLKDDSGSWVTTNLPSWDEEYEYRFKPKMLTIAGSDGKVREYPEPCKIALKNETDYFVPATSYVDNIHDMYRWYDDDYDKNFLSKGLIHLTKEAAELHAKAMLGID